MSMLRASVLSLGLSFILALGGTYSDRALADSWDIGAYDSCIKMPYDKIDKLMNDYVEHIRYCCWKSGGKWTGRKCVAHPAESTSTQPPKKQVIQ